MDFRAWIMWYMDIVWCFMLYCFHFTFSCHCDRQVNKWFSCLIWHFLSVLVIVIHFNLSHVFVCLSPFRYWAVTNVDYMHSRTSRRVFMMIILVWVASVIVSLAPQFGWKDPEYLQRIEQLKCMVSQDVGYQVSF